METIKHLINGEYVGSDKVFANPNPATGEILAEIAAGGEAEIAAAVAAAREAFPKWAGRPAKQRAKIMRRLGELIEHADYAFVHATLKIGGGRDEATKTKVCDELFATMKAHFAELFARRYLALSLGACRT